MTPTRGTRGVKVPLIVNVVLLGVLVAACGVDQGVLREPVAEAGTPSSPTMSPDQGGDADPWEPLPLPSVGACLHPKVLLWPMGGVHMMAEHLTPTEVAQLDTLPVDGIVHRSIRGWELQNTNFDPSHRQPGSGPVFGAAAVYDGMSSLKALKKVKQNFIAVFMGMMPDFFDSDATWKDYIASVASFAEAANQLGWPGVFFDDEQYAPPAWQADWFAPISASAPAQTKGGPCGPNNACNPGLHCFYVPKKATKEPPGSYCLAVPGMPARCAGQPSGKPYRIPGAWAYAHPNPSLSTCVGVKHTEHDLNAYILKARQRGRELMTALIAAYPTITFVVAHGPARTMPKAAYDATVHGKLIKHHLPSFLQDNLESGFYTGLVDAVQGTGARLINGNENYREHTTDHMAWIKTFMTHDFVDADLVKNTYLDVVEPGKPKDHYRKIWSANYHHTPNAYIWPRCGWWGPGDCEPGDSNYLDMSPAIMREVLERMLLVTEEWAWVRSELTVGLPASEDKEMYLWHTPPTHPKVCKPSGALAQHCYRSWLTPIAEARAAARAARCP
jgi:hypothetical protein